MTTHSRETKVLVILGISIILGAIILNALGHNPPSAGAFCLSRYYRLDSVEESILSRAAQYPKRWSRIEIYYSGTESDNINQLALLDDIDGFGHINCHFVICDGRIGYDGQIQSTEKWQRQSSVMPGQDRNSGPDLEDKSSSYSKPCIQTNVFERLITDSEQTIRICIIADAKTVFPTVCQVKRTEALVEKLCKKFFIQPQSVHFPYDWL